MKDNRNFKPNNKKNNFKKFDNKPKTNNKKANRYPIFSSFCFLVTVMIIWRKLTIASAPPPINKITSAFL